MNFVIENWFVLLGIFCLVFCLIYLFINFLGLPTQQQIEKIKKWLLWAVCEAERLLGEETGQLKLSYVYNLFIEKFPITAKFITFETFSKYVDLALEEMREMLEKNPKIVRYIYGEEEK